MSAPSRGVLARLVPRRLAGQTIAVLLLTLLVAQAAGVLFLIDERGDAVRSAVRDQVGGRVIQVVRLLETLPQPLHAEILEASGSPSISFQLARESTIPQGDSESSERVARILTRILDRPSTDDVRVDQGEPRPFLQRPFGGTREGVRERSPAAQERLAALTALDMAIAVRLRDGSWLNTTAVVRVPPPTWATASLVTLGVTAVALIAVVVLMVRRLNRPLRALETTADAVGRGMAVAPVPEAGPEDVRTTIRAFNRMNERQERFIRDRTRILAAVSHDLRTPITSLRLRAEMVDDADTRDRLVETIDEMQQIVEAGLTFAREESETEPSRTVDLAALVESVATDLSDLGRDVTVEEAGPLPWPCRPAGLKRALRNLIENAVVYGGRARVALARGPEWLEVRVDDDGPGIPDEQRERVFEPFARLEESRSRETGGIGLGLAIARSIARRHGGDVVLENRMSGGLRATLRLPVA